MNVLQHMLYNDMPLFYLQNYCYIIQIFCKIKAQFRSNFNTMAVWELHHRSHHKGANSLSMETHNRTFLNNNNYY